jgi:O-acetyl-ADP-ribose deacetylase (regulator of RNase III)
MRGPLSFAVGCEWRRAGAVGAAEAVAPLGFVRYRQQMAAAGAPITFRLPAAHGRTVRLLVRFGCIGAAALSGRHDAGGVVTSSNPLLCGNKSLWWGFAGKQNADGILRKAAGPGLAEECDRLRAIGPDGEKVLAGGVRATGAHNLAAACVLHAVAPTSSRAPGAEALLRRTYEACLQLADERELPSLALPALGCGVNAFPPGMSAKTAFDAVEHAIVDPEPALVGGALATVEFVLHDEDCYATFADAAHVRWGKR